MTELELLDAYWRAANYLSVGQIYLLDNPLLREPLRPEHIKPRLLGHFGTTPGLNLVYAHLNRAIRKRELRRSTSPAPATAGRGWWRTPIWRAPTPRCTRTSAGTRTGYASSSASSPSPAGSRATSRPRRRARSTRAASSATRSRTRTGPRSTTRTCVVACVVGDGEAETGPLAASWHSNKFLNPATDGAVLPILHLNGYKIANPTVLARIPEEELVALFEGYGHRPLLVTGGFDGEDPLAVHERLAARSTTRSTRSAQIQAAARAERRPSGRAGR